MNPTFRIIPLYLLCFALIFSGCSKKDSVQEQFDSKLVLNATLEVGASVQDIEAKTLMGQGSVSPISDLQIRISTDNEEVLLVEDPESPGTYHGPEEFELTEQTAYELSTSYKGSEIRASTITPASMGELDASKRYIEANIQGDLVFLNWDDINTGSFREYFYLIELLPAEEEPEALMRFSGESTKSTMLSYNASATLSIDDFNYYGEHILTIYAVSNEYEYLFAEQQDLSSDGPTNISGAYGYMIGTSTVRTTLEIR